MATVGAQTNGKKSDPTVTGSKQPPAPVAGQGKAAANVKPAGSGHSKSVKAGAHNKHAAGKTSKCPHPKQGATAKQTESYKACRKTEKAAATKHNKNHHGKNGKHTNKPHTNGKAGAGVAPSKNTKPGSKKPTPAAPQATPSTKGTQGKPSRGSKPAAPAPKGKKDTRVHAREFKDSASSM